MPTSTLLEDRTLLLLQMQAYAACDDPEIRAATRAGYKRLWEMVERLTGLPFQTVVGLLRHRHADERGRGHGPAVRRRAWTAGARSLVPEQASRQPTAAARTRSSQPATFFDLIS